ncbi:ABC transporter permease, partial [Candidatus Sumerlaeota bacterium]|nr:ABC transporter permease [Candidatus Sumerlaeota bacterium]
MNRKKHTANEKISKGHSPWALMMRRLIRNRIAMSGAGVLIVLYLGAIFADFLSPYHPHKQDLMNFYHPPTTIHFIDENGKFYLRPFVYRYELVDLDRIIYKPDKTKKYFIKFFVKGHPYK